MKKFGDIIKNSKKNADDIVWTKCGDSSKYNYPKNLTATAFSSSFFYIFFNRNRRIFNFHSTNFS